MYIPHNGDTKDVHHCALMSFTLLATGASFQVSFTLSEIIFKFSLFWCPLILFHLMCLAYVWYGCCTFLLHHLKTKSLRRVKCWIADALTSSQFSYFSYRLTKSQLSFSSSSAVCDGMQFCYVEAVYGNDVICFSKIHDMFIVAIYSTISYIDYDNS